MTVEVEITASLVKTLRERTGVGMMECKKALVAANGDLEHAIEDLRKIGQAKAVKKGDRIAAEGIVAAKVAADNRYAVIVEVNCETDFVAREEKFKHFANLVAEVALAENITDVAALTQSKVPGSDKTVEETRLNLVAQLGENIALRRMHALRVETGMVAAYLHGGAGVARIGALVAIDTDRSDVAKDLAMQIAAMKPECIDAAAIEPARLEKEKEILLVQAREANQGKPEEILNKILSGMITKFIREITLVGQASIKDPKQTIEQLLQAAKTKVTGMMRFEVGEGIEKQADNFVAEVMSQVRNS